MNPTELHRYEVEIQQDTGIVRFHCPRCQRCLETGPDGMRLLHRGDQGVRHVGGDLTPATGVQPIPSAPPTLH